MLRVALKSDVELSPLFLHSNNKDEFCLGKFILQKRRNRNGFVYLDKDDKDNNKDVNIPSVMVPFVDGVWWEEDGFVCSAEKIERFGLRYGIARSEIGRLDFRYGVANATFRYIADKDKLVGVFRILSLSVGDFYKIFHLIREIEEDFRCGQKIDELQEVIKDLTLRNNSLLKQNAELIELNLNLEKTVASLEDLIKGREKELEVEIGQLSKQKDDLYNLWVQARDENLRFKECVVKDFLRRNQEE